MNSKYTKENLIYNFKFIKIYFQFRIYSLMNLKLDLLLTSIIIGISIMYILSPKPEVILKMPNESNIYIDTNNVCYKYVKEYIYTGPIYCKLFVTRPIILGYSSHI